MFLNQGAGDVHVGNRVVTYNDPHVPQLPKMRAHVLPELASNELTPQYLAEQDCVLIATDHSSYDYPFIVEHARLVGDVEAEQVLGARLVDRPDGRAPERSERSVGPLRQVDRGVDDIAGLLVDHFVTYGHRHIGLILPPEILAQ